MKVTDILEERPELSLGQAGSEVVADLIQVGTGVDVAESEVADVVAEVEKTGVLKVVGSLSSYMMRLGEEYTKALQSINPHTQEYIRRLKDESVVVELAAKVQAYYERQGEMNVAADLALLQVCGAQTASERAVSAVRVSPLLVSALFEIGQADLNERGDCMSDLAKVFHVKLALLHVMDPHLKGQKRYFTHLSMYQLFRSALNFCIGSPVSNEHLESLVSAARGCSRCLVLCSNMRVMSQGQPDARCA